MVSYQSSTICKEHCSECISYVSSDSKTYFKCNDTQSSNYSEIIASIVVSSFLVITIVIVVVIKCRNKSKSKVDMTRASDFVMKEVPITDGVGMPSSKKQIQQVTKVPQKRYHNELEARLKDLYKYKIHQINNYTRATNEENLPLSQQIDWLTLKTPQNPVI